MKLEEFNAYAEQGFNHIPIFCELLADLETPLSVYMKLANRDYSYLFESVQGGEKWGRYSIIGLPAEKIIKVIGQEITVTDQKQVSQVEKSADPLSWLEKYKQKFRSPKIAELPSFCGGLVGYFAYDVVQYIEPRLNKYQPADPLQTPDILLMVSNEIIIFDKVKNKIFIVVYANPSIPNACNIASQRLNELIKQMQSSELPHENREIVEQTINDADFESGQTYETYARNIEKIKKYIYDGDVMQVGYSRRISIQYTAEPLNLYRAIRYINPSPYLYFLNCGDFCVVGASPEILVKVDNDIITERPIAGTRPRGNTEAEDLALEQDLLSDPKEIAEHVMLIDLGRNDIGRICEIGSVKVTEKMVIERYSHVMHIVSNVIGKLKPDMSAFEVLRATFPAGTVTGAPKIRAIEILYELEPIKRGIYSGAVGYIGWNDAFNVAIAIRTAIIKNKHLYIQAGGGIVADSIPQNEWDETQNKAKAMLRAVALAVSGLKI